MRHAVVEYFVETLTDETVGRLCWTVDLSYEYVLDESYKVTTGYCDALFEDLGNASHANKSSFLWSFSSYGGVITHDVTGYCLDTFGGNVGPNTVLVARRGPCDRASQVWRPSMPEAYLAPTPGVDDDATWRWEEVLHAASGLCVDVKSAATTPNGQLQLYECNGGTAQWFGVVEFLEEADARLGPAGSDMFTNASFVISRARVDAVNGPLSELPRSRLRAYATSATGLGPEVSALGLGLPPEARFRASSRATIEFAQGRVGNVGVHYHFNFVS